MTDEKKKKLLIVRCPTCKKSTRYDETNAFRPFCSAICKDHDIIAWAEEKFRVPAPTLPEDEEEGRPPSAQGRSPVEE
jgi:endogenous inhibitor of DNA gyrase (YacG/DUF329 family)